MVDTACFDGVVGLANCACPCLTDTAPEGYNDSTADLYIADLIPLSMTDGAEDCSNPSNPWNLLDNARTQGKNTLLKDIKAGLMKKNQLTRQPFKGMIGEKSGRETTTLSKDYAGLRIAAPRIKGAFMRITNIGGVFSANGTVSVQIYDRFNNTVGSPVSITTVANNWRGAACDISLPLWVDGADRAEYYLVYESNQANLPKTTRPWCPSCNKMAIPTFSLDAPYYTRKWVAAQSWANWIMVGAIETDAIDEFDLIATNPVSGFGMNGLTVSCEFSCDPATSVCMDELDFNDPVAMSLAHSLRYISAIHAAEKIIRNPDPYRNAAVSKEILAVDIQQWWKDYQANVEYVVYNANLNNSDCIFCKPKFALSLESKLP